MGQWVVLVGLLAAMWALQMYLTSRQARAFMAQVRRLRAAGGTAIGVSSTARLRPRTYVALAAVDGVVVDAVELSGVTVWARPRPVEHLRGRSLIDLADGDANALDTAAGMAAAALLDATDGPEADDAPDGIHGPEDGDVRDASGETGDGRGAPVGEVSGIG